MFSGLAENGVSWTTVFVGLLNILVGGVLVSLIRTRPAIKKIANEGRKIQVDEHALIRTDYVRQITDLRVAIHDMRNELQIVNSNQLKTDRMLAESTATNRHNKDQMSTMLFLIRLLISELKRLDPDSIIVAQAEATLAQMTQADDPSKSPLRNVAEHALADAKQTVISTERAVIEINADEAKEK